jgi:hypothetical protein
MKNLMEYQALMLERKKSIATVILLTHITTEIPAKTAVGLVVK